MIRSVGLLAALLFAANVLAQTAGFFPKGEFPKTDFENRSVNLASILSGGPPKDGIPSIDAPDFTDTLQAQEWLSGDEPVVAFYSGDDARAYPLQILIYHEIVNDVVDGKPVTITFCPLCNASIVFDRNIKGEVLDFGTTGRLRYSDLIMYDRQSETWWQQFTGRGIIGKYNEVKLKQLPSQIVSFDTFRSTFPNGKILTRETGHNRPYGNNPYTGYDNINSSPFLYDGPVDKRLPPMERVLTLASEDNSSMLIPVSRLEDNPILNISYQEKPVVVIASSFATSALDKGNIATSRKIPAAAAFSSELNGETLQFQLNNGELTDKKSGSVWNVFGHAIRGTMKGQQLRQVDSGVHFAFAWLAFEPGSNIHEIKDEG